MGKETDWRKIRETGVPGEQGHITLQASAPRPQTPGSLSYKMLVNNDTCGC